MKLAKGLAETAGPFVVCAAFSLAAAIAGCTAATVLPSDSPPQRPPAPPPDSFATPPAAPSGAVTPYRLLIEPMQNQSSPPEVRSDFREEIRTVIASTNLFAEVVTESSSPPDLFLRPVLLLERVSNLDQGSPVIELAIRFELGQTSSGGLLWEGEYRELSPSDLAFQSQLPDRQRLIAVRAIRKRILESLRQDLFRFILAY